MPSNAIHDDQTIMKILSQVEQMSEDADKQMSQFHMASQLFDIFYDLLEELGWLKQSHMVLLNQWDELEKQVKSQQDQLQHCAVRRVEITEMVEENRVALHLLKLDQH